MPHLPEPPLKSSRSKRHTSKDADSHAIAAAAFRRWELVQARLAPIIGQDGFRVLFARSLHRARAEHPWLARDPVAGADPFSTLKASIEAQEPDRAGSGSRSLMEHFNVLLHALIGEELASRLLDAGRPPHPIDQETRP